MPHSLRARLSNLRYKKIISDKDYVRLCKALDNENVLDKIRAEIDSYGTNSGMLLALEILDKYKTDEEIIE